MYSKTNVKIESRGQLLSTLAKAAELNITHVHVSLFAFQPQDFNR
jgi:hypothetical protein